MAFITAYINTPLLPPLTETECFAPKPPPAFGFGLAEAYMSPSIDKWSEIDLSILKGNYNEIKQEVNEFNTSNRDQRIKIVIMAILIILGAILSVGLCAAYWKKMNTIVKVCATVPVGMIGLILAWLWICNKKTLKRAKDYEEDYYVYLRNTLLKAEHSLTTTKPPPYSKTCMNNMKQNQTTLQKRLSDVQLRKLEHDIKQLAYLSYRYTPLQQLDAQA